MVSNKKPFKISLIILAIFIVIILLMVFLYEEMFFAGAPIRGDHYYVGGYERGIGKPEFEKLEDAYENYEIEEDKLIYSFSTEKYIVVLKQDTTMLDGKRCIITGYEFFNDGTYSLMGTNGIIFSNHDTYGKETTLRQDLQRFLDASHLGFLKLAELYNALPAWGVANGDWILDVEIDEQPIDEFIPIEYENNQYFIWIIHDLKTVNNAIDINISGINE